MPNLLTLESLESDRAYVAKQLEQMVDSVWGTARSMWQSRLAEIDERIAELNATRSAFASVALVFDGSPVVGSADIRLDFAASALDAYQRMINLSVASKLTDELPARGRLPGAAQSRLFIRDLVHGSMGFILEEIATPQAELLPTILKEAVEDSTKLIETLSGANDEIFAERMGATQPRLVAAIQRFTKVLSDNDASTRILGDYARLALTSPDVARLSARLSEFTVMEDTTLQEGRLLGLLPESLQFELELPGGAGTERGTVSLDLATRFLADKVFVDSVLLQLVNAEIRTVRTYRQGTVVKAQTILESVSPAAQMAPRRLE